MDGCANTAARRPSADVQDALDNADAAVGACQRSCNKAKARRVVLLATSRALNVRYMQASAALLSCLRDAAPRPCGLEPKRSPTAPPVAPTAHLQRHGRAAPTPPPQRFLAPLHLSVLSPASPPDSPEHGTPPPLRVHESASAYFPDDPDADPDVPLQPFEVPDIGGSAAMAARLRAARRAAADGAGVAPEAVRWVLQSPHIAPDGTAVSFTSDTVTAGCVVSMYVCFFISLLEEALLAAALRSVKHGADTGDAVGAPRPGLNWILVPTQTPHPQRSDGCRLCCLAPLFCTTVSYTSTGAIFFL